ncbi:hypothetical protein JXQ70_11530 [bacterium]|nr:hypothetical protein [bacterium]
MNVPPSQDQVSSRSNGLVREITEGMVVRNGLILFDDHVREQIVIAIRIMLTGQVLSK